MVGVVQLVLFKRSAVMEIGLREILVTARLAVNAFLPRVLFVGCKAVSVKLLDLV